MDESYEDSEKSVMGNGCGLCDLRDLAHCALVTRHWYLTVQDVLYVQNQKRSSRYNSLTLSADTTASE